MDMKYKVIITSTAFKEINKIYDYILEELYTEKVLQVCYLKNFLIKILYP